MYDKIMEWFFYRQGTLSSTFLTIDHVIGLSFLGIMLYILFVNREKLVENNARKKAKTIMGITALISLTFLRIFEYNQFKTIYRSMPFHFCSIAYILNIISMFTNNKHVRTYAVCMGITGGVFGLLVPGMYIRIYYYRALEYYFSHSLLVTMSIFLVLIDGVKLQNRKINRDYSIFLFVSSLFMIVWNNNFNTDYYFLSGTIANGPTAFLNNMFPWPGYYFILLPFAIICGHLLHLVPAFTGSTNIDSNLIYDRKNKS